jgi:arginase family enzyme
LTHGSMKIIWRDDLNEVILQNLFKEIQHEVSDQTAVVFSLDADALAGQEVPGVSAVNPQGLSLNELKMIWKKYSELKLHHPALMGIYELNPVYDSVSMLSMRVMSSFLYQTL